MTVHYLKIKPEYYKDVQCGLKTFELRKNDRDFKVGDVLMLIKLDGEGNETDQGTRVKVTYILKDCPQYGLKEGYAILGIGVDNRIGGTIALPNGEVGYIKNAKYVKLGYATNDVKTTVTDAAGNAINGDDKTKVFLTGTAPMQVCLDDLDNCVKDRDGNVYYVGDIGHVKKTNNNTNFTENLGSTATATAGKK